ncbi:hypothetical protein CJ030_MR8G020269 [Morella rubra]|uniref:Uncharacterized protein n=1 Tax=Morella rubra TaxID=262757 RepID=A0A6A1UQM7_9ROSI|nr:hypothetical protein CJ030_MR8G020269 [Morella rubra]
MGPWPLSTAAFHGLPIHHWVKFLLNPSNLPQEVQDEWHLMMLAVTITLDTIWSTRNRILDEHVEFDLMELQRSIQRRYYAHCEAWNPQVQLALISWVTLREDALKINYDAAVRDPWICVAAVRRNWKGEVLKIAIRKFRGGESPDRRGKGCTIGMYFG